jgi:hypothetical protein
MKYFPSMIFPLISARDRSNDYHTILKIVELQKLMISWGYLDSQDNG